MEQEEAWESWMVERGTHTKAEINSLKKVREKERKTRLASHKKEADIPLLEFTRQVVEMTMRVHADGKKAGAISSQQVASEKLGPLPGKVTPTGKLSAAVLETVRFDSGRHLPKKTEITGVCKVCKSRSLFRCIRCNVALHPECFIPFHVPAEELGDQ